MKARVVQGLSGPSGMSYRDVPDVLLSKGEYQLKVPTPSIAGGVYGKLVLEPR